MRGSKGRDGGVETVEVSFNTVGFGVDDVVSFDFQHWSTNTHFSIALNFNQLAIMLTPLAPVCPLLLPEMQTEAGSRARQEVAAQRGFCSARSWREHEAKGESVMLRITTHNEVQVTSFVIEG